MTEKFNELVLKLKEIYQLDKPELDFGIYRIMHARAKEINEFLEKRLQEKVKAAIAGNTAAEKSTLEADLAEKVDQVKALGMNPDDVPAIKEIKDKIAALGGDDDAEASVYSHLLAFFSRYYDDGDFISKRRYKDGVYAIPYSGEEVKLHWANADQYYTKSGESFTNYSFKLDDGAKVHFKLLTAETAKDNIKDNECVRCFVLWDPALKDDVEDEELAGTLPDRILEEKDGELYIYFQYRKFKKGAKQSDFTKDAREKIFAEIGTQHLMTKFNVMALVPTEKDKKRTVFDKHFETYSAKNTSDYFIHKDLKGFLSRELDFYIKNEMMHLDDIQSAHAFKDIECNLRQIQAVRLIATELITFMAQLEDFQKKLWLKKKFVVQCDYCITMDRVPQELHAEVLANKAQIDEWKRFGVDINPKDSDMMAVDARMVDTKFFGEEFKAKLLKSIPDLDEQCDGLLIHSENFQTLNLLEARYCKLIKCVYIDPPYNAKSSEILYKNTFKHSSWLSLMENRVDITKKLLTSDGVLEVAIDEIEVERLGLLLDSLMVDFDGKKCVSVIINPSGQQGKNFSTNHENVFFYFHDTEDMLAKENRSKENADVRGFMNGAKGEGGNYLRCSGKNCFYPILVKDGNIVGFGDVCTDEYHPGAPNVRKGDLIEVYPVDGDNIERKWLFERGTVEGIKDELSVKPREGGIIEIIRTKTRINFKTSWNGSRYNAKEHGTMLLSKFFNKGTKSFSFPKSLFSVKDCVDIGVNGRTAIVLDYFGGSGTTAHAVISLNRDDLEKTGSLGKRKYILVEMGDHFDTVLKPRVQKVVYSPDWKGGKPTVTNKGISHCFKYMTLESYEDTLNNIELEDKGSLFSGTMKDEYLLGYMLDVESKGSVINTDDFRHPFDYQLKIAVDSSGASEKRKVDLVETFNYLIGLKVAQYVRQIDKGYAFLEGTLPGGENAFIMWRDCDKVDDDELNKLLAKHGVKPGTSEYDVIYVNGDHAVANVTLGADADGKTLKVRQIENEFLEKMFAETK